MGNYSYEPAHCEIFLIQYDTDYSHQINNDLYFKHLMIFTLLTQNKGGNCHIHISNILNITSNTSVLKEQILSKPVINCEDVVWSIFGLLTFFLVYYLELGILIYPNRYNEFFKFDIILVL